MKATVRSRLRVGRFSCKSAFVWKTSIAAVMFLAPNLPVLYSAREPASRIAEEQTGPQSFEQYLEKSVVSRTEVDRFLAGTTWAKFDPELGYVLSNSIMPWGIDHSSTIETLQADGSRTSFLYPSWKARINTYGDSWTECEQVNDGET